MKLERSLEERRRLCEAMRGTYHNAVLCKVTSSKLNEMVANVRNRAAKGTPNWVFAHLEGYRQALDERLNFDEIVYGGYDGDKFLSTHSNRDDYYAKNGVEPRDYAENGRIRRKGLYWGTDTSKPFFISDKESDQ